MRSSSGYVLPRNKQCRQSSKEHLNVTISTIGFFALQCFAMSVYRLVRFFSRSQLRFYCETNHSIQRQFAHKSMLGNSTNKKREVISMPWLWYVALTNYMRLKRNKICLLVPSDHATTQQAKHNNNHIGHRTVVA